MKRLATLWSAALITALGIGLLAAPGAARAQTSSEGDPELSTDWAIHVGPYFFNSKTSRSVGGSVGISALAERRVYRGNVFDVTVGAGYNGFDRVYSVPVLINAVGKNANVRYGAGVGYSFNKRVSGQGSNGSVLDLLLGYQLTHGKNPISADLRYFFVGGSSNELDGYSLTLGVQF